MEMQKVDAFKPKVCNRPRLIIITERVLCGKSFNDARSIDTSAFRHQSIVFLSLSSFFIWTINPVLKIHESSDVGENVHDVGSNTTTCQTN